LPSGGFVLPPGKATEATKAASYTVICEDSSIRANPDIESRHKVKNETPEFLHYTYAIEPLAKLWVDEWQSHFESIFGME